MRDRVSDVQFLDVALGTALDVVLHRPQGFALLEDVVHDAAVHQVKGLEDRSLHLGALVVDVGELCQELIPRRALLVEHSEARVHAAGVILDAGRLDQAVVELLGRHAADGHPGVEAGVVLARMRADAG